MFNSAIERGPFSKNLEDFDSVRSVLLYSDLEPEWLDSVQKNGELFYLELSEDEEEVALARAHANYGLSTNHVRFSDKEAEVIAEADGQRRSDPRAKGEPKLKKLARLLRRTRHSQRRAGGKSGVKDGSSRPPASILKNQAGQRPGVAVQQEKEVCVYVNPKRLTLLPEGGGGLLASLLGLVHRPCPGRGNPAAGGEGEMLTVHGLVPNSPALRGGQILIGDVLVAVDDVAVTTESIERVLSCIPGPTQVRLTLETSAPAEVLSGPVGAADPPAPSPSLSPPSRGWRAKASPPVSQLVRLLWGEDTTELQMSIAHMPHVAMYLSLKLDSDTQLPRQREDFVLNGHIVSSSLLLGRHLVHVGYWKEGSKLLVLGLPAERVPLLYLQTVLGGLVRTLQVMYGSLDSAFCLADHAPRLDHFFCLFFQQLILPSGLTHGCPPGPRAPGPRPLSQPLPGRAACDGVVRLRGAVGGLLWLEEGYLIANHLPREDLLDVCLYCRHYCLLPLTSEQRVGQLVVWREVFPRQRSHQGAPPRPRHFLLIVGLRHLMQCVLMEVKATLLQLETLEGGMEERLSGPAVPCISCADWFLPAIPRMRKPDPFHLGTLKKILLTERETEDMVNHIKLTTGVENTLFHYVLMDAVQGVFIAPTHHQGAQLSGSIHPQLIRNFHHCCLSIRAAFQQSLTPRGPQGGGAAERRRGGLGPVKEHGVLFQCKAQSWTDQKKPAPTMTYWVIGRMLLEPVPQEFYVCFHDSVPEIPVELAFRLSFGLAL
ncbi:hypothetical protein NHX12_013774, partial [Muraenolepis orangiensis]